MDSSMRTLISLIQCKPQISAGFIARLGLGFIVRKTLKVHSALLGSNYVALHWLSIADILFK